jgi:hypothetical protein
MRLDLLPHEVRHVFLSEQTNVVDGFLLLVMSGGQLE